MYFGGSLRGKLIILLKIFWGNLVIKLFNLSQHSPPPPPNSLFLISRLYLSLPLDRLPLLSISLSFYLAHPPKPTHLHTLAPSISLTPSPVNQPSTTTFGGFHQRTPLEIPYAQLSQTLKVKLFNYFGSSSSCCKISF